MGAAMKKLVSVIILMATIVYGEAIIYNITTGPDLYKITAIEPEETTFLGDRILGSKVYNGIDWTKISLGNGTDCWDYTEAVYTNSEGEVYTNITRSMKANMSQVSDFIETRSIWEQAQYEKGVLTTQEMDKITVIADKYGVTNRPVDLNILRDAIYLNAQSNLTVAADGIALNISLTLYEKLGGDILNIR
jgi:hypothetical protein